MKSTGTTWCQSPITGKSSSRAIAQTLTRRLKGQVYLTVVYDLERRVLLWVGDDRTEEAVRPFFTKEMGKRRCRSLRVICMDTWVSYANLVREHAPHTDPV